MRTLAARYAAWCRRQGTVQCNPAAIGLFILAVCGVLAIQAGHELAVHWTGFIQVAAGAGAALACLAAGGLVTGAMRIVEATPVPVNPVLDVPTSRKPATVLAMTLRPEERAEMEAEADLLAGSDTTLLVSGNGALYGLQDEPEDAP
jgi:hypothetical protein